VTDSTVGQAFIELRARGTQLRTDISSAVNKAIPTGASQATKSLGAEVKGLTQQFAGLFGQSRLTSVAMTGFQTAEAGAAAGASSLATPLVAVGAAAIGAAAGATVAVHAFGDFAGQVVRVQQVTLASAKEASAFVAVFDRFGVNVQTGARALAIFSRTAEDNKDKLSALGVSIRTAADGSLDLIGSFGQVADAVKNATSAEQQNQIIQTAFGRSGLALLPVLKLGAAGFEEIAAQAKAAGLSLDENGIARFIRMREASRDLGESFQGLKVRIGGELAPAFTQLERAAVPVITAIGAGLTYVVRGFALLVDVIRHPTDIGNIDKLRTKIIGVAGAMDTASASADDFGDSLEADESKLASFVQAEINAASATFAAKDASFAFLDAQSAVIDAQTRYNELLHRSGAVAREFAAAQREIERSSFDVGQAQRDLNIAVLESGSGSNRTAKANETLKEALDRQKDAAQKLSDLNDQTGPKGTETIKAARDLEQARLKEAEAAEHSGRANAELKDALDKANGKEVLAATAADRYRQALLDLAKTLAPGSELRKNLEDTANAIRTEIPDAIADAIAFAATHPLVGAGPLLPGQTRDTGPTPAPLVGQGPLLPGQTRTGAIFPPTPPATVTITNNFYQPVDLSQASALNTQQAAGVGGGTKRTIQ